MSDAQSNLDLALGVGRNVRNVFTREVLPNMLTFDKECIISSVEEFNEKLAAGDAAFLATIEQQAGAQNVVWNNMFSQGDIRTVMELATRETSALTLYLTLLMAYLQLTLAYRDLGSEDHAFPILWTNKCLVTPDFADKCKQICEDSKKVPEKWEQVHVEKGAVFFLSRGRRFIRLLIIAFYLAIWILMAVIKVMQSSDNDWREMFFRINESVSYGLMYAALVGLGAFRSVRDLSKYLRGWLLITDVHTLCRKLHVPVTKFISAASHMKELGAVFSYSCCAVREPGEGGLSGEGLFALRDCLNLGYIIFKENKCFDFFRNRLLSWGLKDNGIHHIEGNATSGIAGAVGTLEIPEGADMYLQ